MADTPGANPLCLKAYADLLFLGIAKMNNLTELKSQLCDVCHTAWQLGWVAANDGNVSARVDANTLLCTPSGVSKREITPEMLILTDMEGNLIEGDRKPSTELPMHLCCYMERPDVGAVVHAHPPMSTSFAVANVPLDDYAMIETILTLGNVPIAPYAPPGTDQLPESIRPFLHDHDAILMRAHGALTVGKDLRTALYRMETLEHFAKITLCTKLLGGAKDLELPQINELIERRESFYHLTGKHPGYKKL